MKLRTHQTLCFVLLLTAATLHAQPQNPDAPAEGAPLGGLIILIAAGAAYGVRYAVKKNGEG